MRTTASVVLVAWLATSCSNSTVETTTLPPTTAVEVNSPTALIDEWVPASLRPEGLLIGDTLTYAGDRYVVFEEIDGRRLAVWTSDDGRSWSPGDASAFPEGSHVRWARGNEHGAIVVGWSGLPSWPPDPESPPVLDRVWTTTDGATWTSWQFAPPLPDSTEYLQWYAEVGNAVVHEEGFLLTGQVRWFVDGQAVAAEVGVQDDVVVFPSVTGEGGCTLEGLTPENDSVFSAPCAQFGINPESDGLFVARPPVLATGSSDGSWSIVEPVGLDGVSVAGAGVAPDGVSLFSFPEMDGPRYWTSVDLQTWQTVEGIPGIEADGVFSMRAWRDGWVADVGYGDREGGELWWTRLGAIWAKIEIEGQRGPFAVGPFGLIAVLDTEGARLWFTPDGVLSAVFDIVELFGTDAVIDGFAIGSDSVVAVVSTFDESAEYPWIAKVWVGVPAGE